MTDTHLLLDGLALRRQARRSGAPLQRLLFETLREAIAQGRLKAGAMLPSTRDLAHELGMARNGVIHAYELLSAEGYVLTSRQGTVVAALSALSGRSSVPRKEMGPAMVAQRVQAFHRRREPHEDLRPFMPGVPALDAFPLKVWHRLCEQTARQGQASDLGYRHAMGEPELRQAIATYLQASRGVRCHADQVCITDGTQHSMELCALLLADVGDRVWIEHPGYGGALTAFKQAGLNVCPVTVDHEGMAPPSDWWQRQPPRLIYTSPAHQYPLGSVLSLSRRLSLIEQASRCGAWILEDDYDGEFRHDGPPLSAMQGQVEGAPVVYLGTFSKTMFPALRMGFIVWPEVLADRVTGIMGALARRGHPFAQRALAEFINEGHFTRHLRRMRKLYAARQAALREALARHWPLPGQILGGQAGMHLVLSLPTTGAQAMSDASLAQAAYEQGLFPRPLCVYSTGGVAGFNGLVMGYANTHEEAMEAAVKRLVMALEQVDAQRV